MNKISRPALVVLMLFLTPLLFAQAPAIDLKALKDEVKLACDNGVKYLRYAQKDGRWQNHPGVTALCLQAIFGSPRRYNEKDGPWVRLPLEYLLSMQQENGAFFDKASRKPTENYVTALSLLALQTLGDPLHAERIGKAQKYLIDIQCDEGEKYDVEKDYFYGGIGYGGDERPDLSNLQLALEALRESGLPADHEVFKKALVFVNRCHDGEGNDLDWVAGSGGFAYSPDLPSNENLPTEKTDGKVVVAYGSMTFAGLKSLIFCNVERDDPRVQETLGWIGKNFAVDRHPFFGQSALYYYYQTMAKALDVLDIQTLEQRDGQSVQSAQIVNWRAELAAELLKRQREDGSWVNDDRKYMEGVPELCTAYAMNALNIVYKGL